MHHMTTGVLAVILTAILCTGSNAFADSRPIILDNDYGDWSGLAAAATDSIGDNGVAAGNVDFQRLWVANDGSGLFLRFEVGREALLQDTPAGHVLGNDIRIYIDGDDSSATGSTSVVLGMGTDIEVRLGSRTARRYNPGSTTLSLNEVGVNLAPSHTGSQFEIHIPFAVRPGFGSPVTVIPGPSLRIVMRDNTAGGDRLPDSGSVLYTIDTTPVTEPPDISFSRVASTDIRIYQQNVRTTSIQSDPVPFTRLLQALQPDIINYQEVYLMNATETRDFVAAALGGTWYAAASADSKTVSRWPIIASAASDGNLVCLIDPPDTHSLVDLVVVSAHTPCCTDDAGRDVEHDRIAQTWRNLMNGTGPFATTGSEAVILSGDFNMVGYVRQLQSLRDGDIFDNVTFGPDFAPSRAAGSLTDVYLRASHSRSFYTWRSDGGSFMPGKLDYILTSADLATVKNAFAVYTPEIPAPTLTTLGLLAGDSTASDHVPLVVDLEFPHAARLVDAFILE